MRSGLGMTLATLEQNWVRVLEGLVLSLPSEVILAGFQSGRTPVHCIVRELEFCSEPNSFLGSWVSKRLLQTGYELNQMHQAAKYFSKWFRSTEISSLAMFVTFAPLTIVHIFNKLHFHSEKKSFACDTCFHNKENQSWRQKLQVWARVLKGVLHHKNSEADAFIITQ